MDKVKIIGMSCGHCVQSVQSALEGLGLTSVEVDLDSATATFNPTTAFSREQIAAAIDEIGFEARW